MKTKQIKDIQQKEKSDKWHRKFMDLTKHIATWSLSKRLQVGAIVVKNGHVISQGFNGSLPKIDNAVEDENGITKITSVHAEMNCLTYMAREGISTKDCILYTSTSPCVNCSLLIAACGIKEVYYETEYKDTNGFEILRLANIKITKI